MTRANTKSRRGMLSSWNRAYRRSRLLLRKVRSTRWELSSSCCFSCAGPAAAAASAWALLLLPPPSLGAARGCAAELLAAGCMRLPAHLPVAARGAWGLLLVLGAAGLRRCRRVAAPLLVPAREHQGTKPPAGSSRRASSDTCRAGQGRAGGGGVNGGWGGGRWGGAPPWAARAQPGCARSAAASWPKPKTQAPGRARPFAWGPQGGGAVRALLRGQPRPRGAQPRPPPGSGWVCCGGPLPAPRPRSLQTGWQGARGRGEQHRAMQSSSAGVAGGDGRRRAPRGGGGGARALLSLCTPPEGDPCLGPRAGMAA
jgi:hypothetical protein